MGTDLAEILVGADVEPLSLVSTLFINTGREESGPKAHPNLCVGMSTSPVRGMEEEEECSHGKDGLPWAAYDNLESILGWGEGFPFQPDVRLHRNYPRSDLLFLARLIVPCLFLHSACLPRLPSEQNCSSRLPLPGRLPDWSLLLLW